MDLVVAEALLGTGRFQPPADTLPKSARHCRDFVPIIDDIADNNVIHLKSVLRANGLLNSIAQLIKQLDEMEDENNPHDIAQVSRHIIRCEIRQKRAFLAQILGTSSIDKDAA